MKEENILFIVNCGNKIAKVKDRYYYFNKCEEPTKDIRKLSLVGKDITGYLTSLAGSTNTLSVETTNTNLHNYLDNYPFTQFMFSEYVDWILYLPK